MDIDRIEEDVVLDSAKESLAELQPATQRQVVIDIVVRRAVVQVDAP